MSERTDGRELKAPTEPGSDARLALRVLARILERQQADDVPQAKPEN